MQTGQKRKSNNVNDEDWGNRAEMWWIENAANKADWVIAGVVNSITRRGERGVTQGSSVFES